MSDKGWDNLNVLEQLIRRTARCGMTDGTVMVIEFISGFELFNTRPYHNYETWAQGWRVHGLGVISEKEDLDEAVRDWKAGVERKRAGLEVAPHNDMDIKCWQRDGESYRAGRTLPDWIEAEGTK